MSLPRSAMELTAELVARVERTEPDPGPMPGQPDPTEADLDATATALLANRPDAISGYECGGPGEPCDSEDRPYFRPNNGVTRGQASKIVANTFSPDCNPPQQ